MPDDHQTVGSEPIILRDPHGGSLSVDGLYGLWPDGPDPDRYTVYGGQQQAMMPRLGIASAVREKSGHISIGLPAPYFITFSLPADGGGSLVKSYRRADGGVDQSYLLPVLPSDCQVKVDGLVMLLEYITTRMPSGVLATLREVVFAVEHCAKDRHIDSSIALAVLEGAQELSSQLVDAGGSQQPGALKVPKAYLSVYVWWAGLYEQLFRGNSTDRKTREMLMDTFLHASWRLLRSASFAGIRA